MDPIKTFPLPMPAGADGMRLLLDVLAQTGRAFNNPNADGQYYTVVPTDWRLSELPTIDTPARPTAKVRLRDACSFIAWFNDHKVERSRIYAQLDPAEFVGVVDDFHGPQEPLAQAVSMQADWRQFRATFTVPPSREWKLWNAANRQPMGQLAFAQFIEDNLPDVTVPDGGTLLEMALNFEAVQAGTFIAAQRLQDGSHNLQWKADNNSAGTVKLPQTIRLQIPVFENEAAATLDARLRYRIGADGKLAIWYELVRPHKVLEEAFRATWKRIADETKAVILLGSPE